MGGEERDRVNERGQKERGTQRVGSDPAINTWLMQTRLVETLIKALFREPQAGFMKQQWILHTLVTPSRSEGCQEREILGTHRA